MLCGACRLLYLPGKGHRYSGKLKRQHTLDLFVTLVPRISGCGFRSFILNKVLAAQATLLSLD